MNFGVSTGDWFGAFTGVALNGFVTLDFAVDNAIPHVCESFRLLAPLLGDESWGPATVWMARGCIETDAVLFFVDEEHFSLFP